MKRNSNRWIKPRGFPYILLIFPYICFSLYFPFKELLFYMTFIVVGPFNICRWFLHNYVTNLFTNYVGGFTFVEIFTFDAFTVEQAVAAVRTLWPTTADALTSGWTHWLAVRFDNRTLCMTRPLYFGQQKNISSEIRSHAFMSRIAKSFFVIIF